MRNEFACASCEEHMATLILPKRVPATDLSSRSDVSVRDSVRVLNEIIVQLTERIELLEASERLHRTRPA